MPLASISATSSSSAGRAARSGRADFDRKCPQRCGERLANLLQSLGLLGKLSCSTSIIGQKRTPASVRLVVERIADALGEGGDRGADLVCQLLAAVAITRGRLRERVGLEKAGETKR